jgi:glycosyltransferase involved in cell wall biosynthesis
MNISVIIPAWNAAETIAETLESLLAQTYLGWEAIVVDDGSSDETAAIAANCGQDARIRVVSQPHMGGCVARNTGTNLARFDWLLFLDADDWLLPQHLERMTEALLADPTLDAVYCGWARVTPNGEVIEREEFHQPVDLFSVFACRPLFPPFACVIRRSLVEAVSGFDTSFRTGQDWDFWQRITRTGAWVLPDAAGFGFDPRTASVFH